MIEPATDTVGRLLVAWERFPARVAAFASLSVTLLLTSPAWLEGRVFVGSTDNLFAMLPNHRFSSLALHHGELGLWNPLILGGIDFGSSVHNYLFELLGLPSLIAPTGQLLGWLTFRIALELWAVGFFAFLFLREELGDARRALLCSLLYQMCGFTFFAMTTYPALLLHAMIPAIGHLIWTFPRRRPVSSLAWLTLCFVIVLAAGNIVYCFSAILVTGVLFARRTLSHARWRDARMPAALFAGSGLLAGLLMAPRLLPVARQLFVDGARMAGAGVPVTPRGYLLAQMAVPESFGVVLTDSIPLIKAFSAGDGGHAQFHGVVYFGATALTLLALGLCRLPKPARFWFVWLGAATAWVLGVIPVATVLDWLSAPLVHTIIPKMMLPLPAVTACGWALLALERGDVRVDAAGRRLGVGVVLAFLAIAAVPWAVQQPALAGPLRGLWIGGSLFLGLCLWLWRKMPRLLPAVGGAVLIGLLIAAAVQLAHGSTAMGRSAFAYVGTTCITVWLYWSIREYGGQRRRTRIVSALVLVSLLFVVLALIPVPRIRSGMNDHDRAILALGGSLRFVLVALATLDVLSLRDGATTRGRGWFLALLVFVICDLAPYDKNFSRQVTDSFQFEVDAFPNRDYLLRPRAAIPGGSSVARNASFEEWEPVRGLPADWSVGSAETRVLDEPYDRASGKHAVRIESAGVRPGILQQEIEFVGEMPRVVSFGAWVKSARSRFVPLIVGDARKTALSAACRCVGEWEWVSLSFEPSPGSDDIRLQLVAPPDGEALFDGVRLVAGETVMPFGMNPGDAGESLLAGFEGVTTPADPIDLVHFRMNRPHVALGLWGQTEPQTNLPAWYGVRMVGGVNSDVPARLLELIRALEPDAPAVASGITADLRNPKLLDLLGVGYDADPWLGIRRRESARSRFMLFFCTEVLPADAAVLQRLSSPGFDAQACLVTTETTELPGGLRGRRPERVEFSERRTSEITAEVAVDAPALLFFGDGYNQGWHARVDGLPRSVLRVDHDFMAVALDPGEHRVEFRFEPPLWREGLALAALGAAGLVLALGVLRAKGSA